MNSNYLVIGAMSGTSLDGLDLVCAKFNYENGWTFELTKANTYAYTLAWKTKLGKLASQSNKKIRAVEMEYVRLLSDCINDFKQDLPPVDFISSHGHTVFHQPEKGITLQIGTTLELSKQTHLPVIGDFRSQDVALGGQGAPLVPIGDLHLFKDYTACLNLGGFANFSSSSGEEVIAYDLCAVNTVLNLLAAKKGVDYDDQGHFAQSGKLLPALYEALSALDFYSKKGPKSLGIEWVNKEIIPLLTQFDNAIVEDKLHTYTQHIAHQISTSFSDRDRVLVTGGGAKNSYLIKTLRERSQAQFILPSADLIDFKEALIFAFLGVLRKENQINCLSSVTGARTNHCSGIIFYPQD